MNESISKKLVWTEKLLTLSNLGDWRNLSNSVIQALNLGRVSANICSIYLENIQQTLLNSKKEANSLHKENTARDTAQNFLDKSHNYKIKIVHKSGMEEVILIIIKSVTSIELEKEPYS